MYRLKYPIFIILAGFGVLFRRYKLWINFSFYIYTCTWLLFSLYVTVCSQSIHCLHVSLTFVRGVFDFSFRHIWLNCVPILYHGHRMEELSPSWSVPVIQNFRFYMIGLFTRSILCNWGLYFIQKTSGLAVWADKNSSVKIHNHCITCITCVTYCKVMDRMGWYSNVTYTFVCHHQFG